MFLRSLPRAVYRPLLRSFTTHATRPRTRLNTLTCNALARSLSTTPVRRDLTNILADENPPPVQVNSISEDGILLADGLLLPSSCIFFDGQVFLWDVPQKLWEGWSPERFEFFEATLNRPEILVLGTGRTSVQPPPFIRSYFNTLGIQLEVMDTRNACSTYNMLSEEGRRVAAALLPISSQAWHKVKSLSPKNT
ncbi:hypothetical protein Agabi119p4_4216 [Agaricus bisporus var. burnettii]|uniref:NADH dehydrogenase [ubiquinone] 1 alpha subcomplex assembly factor 3 n=1 Tax=Agaricus bisporus var. burnettii TaxID=192524 RepID=A0A8H7F306_AGABI|nr:hypothetical protein Agabi119p4_4216 [Agaricus bisporus var. burnettii]